MAIISEIFTVESVTISLTFGIHAQTLIASLKVKTSKHIF